MHMQYVMCLLVQGSLLGMYKQSFVQNVGYR